MTDDITDRVKDWTNTAEYAVAHRVGVPFGVSEVKMMLELLAEVERLRVLGQFVGPARRQPVERTDNTNGYGAGVERCLDELRDVLRGDQ